MGIREESGVESETWEESKSKMKVFLQEKLGLETDEIIIERATWDRKERRKKKKDHHSKIFELQAA